MSKWQKLKHRIQLATAYRWFLSPEKDIPRMGIDDPSVVFDVGARPVQCFGYDQNINLNSSPHRSPCWIHDGFETCDHQVKCMNEISKESVLDAVTSLLNIPSPKH